jgi:hypothetical protein
MVSWEKFVIGFRYAHRLKEVEKMTNNLITNFYYSYVPGYDGKEKELRMILDYPTRTTQFLGMQSLSIYDANVKENAKPPISGTKMAALQNIAYLPATMLDDLDDEVCVRHLAESEGWEINDVLELITNPEKLYKLVKVQVPFIDPTSGKKLVPLYLFRASHNLMKFYEEVIGKINENALKIYLTARDNALRSQAKDVAISAWMRKDDRERIIKTIGNRESGLLDLLNKLGIIGEASAAIVNEVASVGNKKHSTEETTSALRSFYGPITKFLQFGHDDVSRIRKDIEEKTGNMLILSMVSRGYQTINESSFKNFIKENPYTISEIATPLIDETYKGLKQLKELDFAYKDSHLATRLAKKIVRRNVENFAKSFHVELDLKWWERAEELEGQLRLT